MNPDTWSWSPNNSGDYWDTGICQMPWGSISYQDGVAQGQPTGSRTYAVSYTATDNADGATATANANVQLHDQWENKVNDSPATTLHEQRTYAPGNYGVSNNTSATFTSAPTFTTGITVTGTIGFSFSPSFDVGWAKILGISFTSSASLAGTFSVTVPGPLLNPGYITYPFILTTWQTDNYLVDNYATTGFAGVVMQSADDPNSITHSGSWSDPQLIGQQPPP